MRFLIALMFLGGLWLIFRFVFLPLWERADVAEKKRRLAVEEELADEILEEPVSPQAAAANRRVIEQYENL